MRLSGIVAAVTLVLAIVACSCVQDAVAAGPPSPNIVFIMIDTLRSDHVGCYGYHRDTTPHIDRFAREGVRFGQMIAASSWTMPSLMTMFTSLPPTLHNATKSNQKLRDGVTTLAAELKKAGYQTAGICSNPTANGKFGFSRGFDLYDDYTIALASDLNLFDDFDDQQRIQAVETSPHVNRLAFRWLERSRKGKFFLFLLYLDPHADYVPPPPYDRMFDADYKGFADGTSMYQQKNMRLDERDKKHIIALYDGEIRYTDKHVGALLKKLEELDLVENTLVVIIADHGEEFWDHGKTLHGHSLYEELVRVPWLIRYPGRLKPGAVIKQQVCHIDVMPTLLDLAGLPIPKQCQGQSLVGLLSDRETDLVECAFLETESRENIKAIRTPSCKFILMPDSGIREAYDLVVDPHEQKNVIDSPPNWVLNLTSRFDRWWNVVEARRKGMTDSGTPELDARTVKQLRGLGYIR